MRRKKSKREIPLVWACDPLTKVETAVHSNARPTRETLAKGEFVQGWQVGREIGNGVRRVDSLSMMAARKTISQDMLAAGLRFRAMFDKAALHGLAAANLDPTPRSTDRVRMTMAENVAYARERVAADLEILGGHGQPLADVAWHVVGAGIGVEDYARRARWAGKALNPKMVTGLVIGALSMLDAKRHRRTS